MFNKTILQLAVLTTVLLIAATSANAADVLSPEQVVAEFQKVPHYEMFCKDESWKGAEPNKVREKFRTYFSKELYRLFMWSECFEPDTPEHYGGLNSNIYFDIRFSISYGNLYLEDTEPIYATDIRIRRAGNKNDATKAIMDVNFNYGSTKMFTSYTLILEYGHWKIDDIAPQGDYIKNPKNEKEDLHNENALDHSDSIKTDMQNNYRAAEDRYKQEQAKKH
jgi:hypothetical protein